MADHNESQQVKIDHASVRDALGRVLNHAHFVAAPRLSSFLRFIVETTLEGNARLIKAYTIATMALERPESFDPAADAIVRVEANRLRNALARYYAFDGADDAIIIELPRGSYVPKFCSREVSEEAGSHWLSDGTVRPETDMDFARMLADKSISNDERMLEVMIDEYRHWISELVNNLAQIRDELTNARTAVAVSSTLIHIKRDSQAAALPLSADSPTCVCGQSEKNCLANPPLLTVGKAKGNRPRQSTIMRAQDA